LSDPTRTVTRVTKRRPGPREPDVDVDGLPPFDGPIEDDVDVYRARVGGDHTGRRGGGEITQAVLDGAVLAETRFDPLSLTDVRVRRADLSNAVWEGVTARRVVFDGCRAVGWRVIAEFAEDVAVQGCKWEHGGLYLARSRGAVVFRDCTFAGTTIRGDLSRVVFDSCDLAGAEFAASAAAGCDLRTSRLEGAHGLLTLAGAVITPEQALEIAHLLAAEVGFELG
jgi:hypothetical protein